MKLNLAVMFTILMAPGILVAAPGNSVGAPQSVTISGTIIPDSCTVTIPASFVEVLTETQIAEKIAGENILQGDTQNIVLTSCVISTNIAIRTNNATPHPFAIDANTDFSTGVDSVTVRLFSGPNEIPVNNLSAQLGTTNSNGDLTFALTPAIVKTTQAYAKETGYITTVDLQLEEL